MTTKDQAIAPTSADYAMGYAEGFNDACKPPAPDCRTCEYKYEPENAKRTYCVQSLSGVHCTNGDQYKPAPKVVLWRTEP